MAVFREEVASLLPGLRAFARALTSGNASLADDLVQDTMLNALQAQHQYTDGTNLEAWLFTILRNRFRSLRTRRHMTAEIGTDDLEPLASVPAAQEARLEVMAFRAAFKRLPVAQREMLVLVTVRGLSYEAAAELCRCEVGTAKSRVHRARAMLRNMLADEPEAEIRVDQQPKATAGSAVRRVARPVPRLVSVSGRPPGRTFAASA
jgi:RNA polymerase sigma-70 factor (ECF subfamily)